MPTYDADLYPRLSAAALALRDPAREMDDLDAEIETATVLLGLGRLDPATLSEADARQYRRAVALQVNAQVEGGIEVALLDSWEQGERTVKYADNGGIHPHARTMADDLLHRLQQGGGSAVEVYQIVKSLR